MRKRFHNWIMNTLTPVFFAALAGAFMMQGFLVMLSWRTIVLPMAATGGITVAMGMLMFWHCQRSMEIYGKYERIEGACDEHREIIQRRDSVMADLLIEDSIQGGDM